MPRSHTALSKLRQICLALPDTKETKTWGKPHFRVGEKIFAGFGEERGVPVIGFKLEMMHAAEVVEAPGFWPAPYLGQKGWVSTDASAIKDWSTLREMIHESYSLIASKKSLAKLDSPIGVHRGKADMQQQVESTVKKSATKKNTKKNKGKS